MADNNRYDYILRVNTASYEKDLQKAVVATKKSVSQMNSAYKQAQGPLAELSARRSQATNQLISSSTKMGRAMSQVSFENKKLANSANAVNNATNNQSNSMRITASSANNLRKQLNQVGVSARMVGQGMRITAKNSANAGLAMGSYDKAGKKMLDTALRQEKTLKKKATVLGLVAKKFRKTKNAQLEAMAATKDYEKTAHVFMKSISRITTGIIISQAFYRATNAIQTTIQAGWEFIGVMQKAEISFTTLMRTGVAESQEFMNVLELMAAKTPFQLDPLRAFNQKLIAMGVNAESMVPIMEGVTNAVAAIGGDNENIIQIGNIFGRIVGKGEVSGRDLNSLARAGIPIYQIFREELNLTNDQLQNIAKQNISATEALNAMMRGFERFDGLADKLAKKTVPGLTSTIKDNVLFTTKNVLKEKHKRYQKFLETVLERMQELRVVSEKFGAKGVLVNLFGRDTTRNILLIVQMFKNLGNAFLNLSNIVSNIAVPTMSGFLYVLYAILSAANILSMGINYLTDRLFGLTIIKRVTDNAFKLLGVILAFNVAMSAFTKVTILLGKVIGGLEKIMLKFAGAVTAVTGLSIGWVLAIGAAILAILKFTGILDKFLAKVSEVTGRLFGLDKISGKVSDSFELNNALLDKYSKELKIGTAFTEEFADAMDGLSDSTASSANSLASFDEAYTLNQGGFAGIDTSVFDRWANIDWDDVFDFSGTTEQFEKMLLQKEKLMHPEDFEVTPKIKEEELTSKIHMWITGIPHIKDWKFLGISFEEILENIKKAWLLINFGGWNPFEADFGKFFQKMKDAWNAIEWGDIELFGLSFKEVWKKLREAWEFNADPSSVDLFGPFSTLWKTIRKTWNEVSVTNNEELFLPVHTAFLTLWSLIKKAWGLASNPEGVNEETKEDFNAIWKYIKTAWDISRNKNEYLMFNAIDTAFESVWDRIIKSWKAYSDEGRDAPALKPGRGQIGAGNIGESIEQARTGTKASTLAGKIQLQQEKINDAISKNAAGNLSPRYMHQIISEAEKRIKELRERMRIENNMQMANGGFFDGAVSQSGMFTREAYYKGASVAENNQKEIVMPTTLDRGDPFIQAIIQGVVEGISTIQEGGNVTFIAADKASLTRLQRKLELIKLSEQKRKGV